MTIRTATKWRLKGFLGAICHSLQRYAIATGLLTLGIVLPAILLSSRNARAQVTSDGTTNTIVSPSGNNFKILNGIEKGNNLFHSFGNFSVPTGGSATFDLVNTPNISTIFSRVTGSTASNIDGLIKTINSSNPVSLFLLNPNGTLFGKEARLQIGGSFIGTTASSIKFADGIEFSARNPAPLLTMSVPIGLQMDQNSSSISSQARVLDNGGTVIGGLQVSTNRNLFLVGGTLQLDRSGLYAPGGRIELVSVAGAGIVELNGTQNNQRLAVSRELARADISMMNNAIVDVTNPQGGSVAIAAQNFSMEKESPRIRAGVARGTSTSPSGNIDIDVVDKLSISSGGMLNRVDSRAGGRSGVSGDINITTGSLFLSNGGQINTSTRGIGNTGNVNIFARDTIALDGIREGWVSSAILSSVRSDGEGNGGNLNLTARAISVTNGAVITASTLGKGNAGTITLNTNTLEALNGGQINNASFSSGNAGKIVIQANDNITLVGQDPFYSQRLATHGRERVTLVNAASGIFAGAYESATNPKEFATGSGGTLQINTPSLAIKDGAQINISALGIGNAGNLKINSQSIQLDKNAQITAEVRAGSQGNIQIQAETLTMQRESLISTNAQGSANGGNIDINSSIILGVGNSDIVANARQGQGGNIEIATQGIFGLEYSDRLTSKNDITASSEFGVNGTVDINNFGVDPSSGLVELPVNLVDSSKLIATGCSNNTGSSFVATGRGGIPQNPNQQVTSDRTWSDIRDLSTYRKTVAVTAQIPQSPEVLVQATSWHRNAQGKVELVADKSSTQMQQALTCAAVYQS